MHVSVVIPTYNRARMLSVTLPFLAAQRLPAGVSMEVIVSDDGSADDTAAVLERLAVQLPLRHVRRARTPDDRWSPGRPRNIGWREAVGEVVTFLDDDMVVAPTFIGRVAELFESPAARAGERPGVVVHSMLGVNFAPWRLQVPAGLDASNVEDVLQRLADDLAWFDFRRGIFEQVDNCLDRLPAPWMLGWTGALSVRRDLLEQVGGFDEQFGEWGSEDDELCYRLHAAGASFVSTTTATALQLPTDSGGSTTRTAPDSHARNRLHVHRKFDRLETELYALIEAPYLNEVLMRLEALVLWCTLPSYPAALLAQLRDCTLARDDELSLLVGNAQHHITAALRPSHTFVVHEEVRRRLEQVLPGTRVERRLGCFTPYGDGSFSVVFLTDFVRLFHRTIQGSLLRELTRIGRRVFLLWTESYKALYLGFESGAWSTFEEVTQAASDLGLVIEPVPWFDAGGPHRVYQVRPA